MIEFYKLAEDKKTNFKSSLGLLSQIYVIPFDENSH